MEFAGTSLLMNAHSLLSSNDNTIFLDDSYWISEFPSLLWSHSVNYYLLKGGATKCEGNGFGSEFFRWRWEDISHVFFSWKSRISVVHRSHDRLWRDVARHGILAERSSTCNIRHRGRESCGRLNLNIRKFKFGLLFLELVKSYRR